MAAQLQQHMLAAMPVFYGTTEASQGKGEKADRFLAAMKKSIAGTHPEPPDNAKVAIIVRQLKGHAFDWYEHECTPRENFPCAYDRARIVADFTYFCQCFEAKFCIARDQSSLSDDISDILPANGEQASTYLDRLRNTLRPVTVLFLQRSENAENAINYGFSAALTQLLQQVHNARAQLPDTCTAEAFTTAITALLREVALTAIRRTVIDGEYLNIARTAGRHVKQEFSRNCIRREMLQANMDLHTLRERVAQEERVNRQPAKHASGLVAEITVEKETVAQDSAPVEVVDGGDSGTEEFGELESHVSAMVQRFNKYKQKRSNRFRGRGKSTEATSGKPAATGGKQKCVWCGKNNHPTEKCTKMLAARDADRMRRKQEAEAKKASGGGSRQQQQQNPTHFGQHPAGGYNYRRNQDSPMDVGQTSAMQYANRDLPMSDYSFPPAGNGQPM